MASPVTPRVLFQQGMDLHRERLHISPEALGNVFVGEGIDQETAMDFDVTVVPSQSSIPLGKYRSAMDNSLITTTDGEEVALKDRVLEYHISPTAKPAIALSKFLLLHEAGHMYRDIAGLAPEVSSYRDPQYVDRLRRIGKVGTAAFAAITLAYIASVGVDTEPWRTIIDVETVVGAIPSGLCMPAAIMPAGTAWMICGEEWRAHGFALRHWKTDVIN